MTPSAKLLCFVACIATCLAQDPATLFEKAPPDIDKALRARVTKFYQLHQEGKFRAADDLVAEDSKDAFFAMEKQRCRAFAIGGIKYSDNFTRAQVMTACDTEITMVMAGRLPVKIPLRSLWKVSNNEWFWYLEPLSDRERMTPFGISKPAPASDGVGFGAARGEPVNPDSLANLVKVDRNKVRLDPDSPATEKLTLTNQMPGNVSFELEVERVAGLTVVPVRGTLGQGETVEISVTYQPRAGQRPAKANMQVVVSPTQQVIPVEIVFTGSTSATPAK